MLALVGLIATAFGGWQMDRWAQGKDEEGFLAEARVTVGMIEQKMERYESAMGRLSDAFAQENGEVSSTNWIGWLIHTLGTSDNYPNVICWLVAPKVTAQQRESFEARARALKPNNPIAISTLRSNASYWYPVWQRAAKSGFRTPEVGDDLLAATPERPSLAEALGATAGWVTDHPTALVAADEAAHVGFWFAVPIRLVESGPYIRWQRRSETGEEAATRRERERAEQVVGLLAAFIGGDLFLNNFNSRNAKVRVQLFTSKTASPETLLNPGHQMPAHPRYSTDVIMPWYGRRWTARVVSTPLFEAGLLRYRTWLILGMGLLLSLGSAAVVAWQIRGRWREASLAAQLREVLARQEQISRDLHDGTLQSVYGVGLALQRAQRLLEKNSSDAVRQIRETTGALQRVIGELRGFIRQTDPGAREEVPLGEALAGVVAHQKLGTEMDLNLEVQPGADHGLSATQSLHLLNIAREALSNSIRHSGGRRVQLFLGRENGTVRLEVADDGRGFNPEEPRRRGNGLRNLAARIRELGGRARWENGSGVRLIVEAPLPKVTPRSPA